MSYVDALPIGAEVGQYAIETVLGQGGFGIVYRARHPVHGRVALKEFYPKSQASRVPDGTIVPSTPRSQEAFAKGVERLLAEGMKLKAFRHNNIVRVIDVFEHNHTAYLAMEEIDGMTLQAAVEGRNLLPSKAMVEDFVAQMVDALKMVHAGGLVHRDVAPDNILVDFKSGAARFVLIDFGGAKRVVTDVSESSSRSLTKTGFSSPEQYGSETVGGMKATPATDIYGLAATLYWLISGKKPIDAPNRSMQDTQPRLAASAALVATYDRNFLSAIDKALTLRPEARPQSADAFQQALKQGVAEASKAGNWKKPVGALVILAMLGSGAYAFMTHSYVPPVTEKPLPLPPEPADDSGGATSDQEPAASAAGGDAATAAAAEAADASTEATSDDPGTTSAKTAESPDIVGSVESPPGQVAVAPPPRQAEQVCHTEYKGQQKCETKYRNEQQCNDEESFDTLTADGSDVWSGVVPSVAVAENICRQQAHGRLHNELKHRCGKGKLGKVDVTCSCDYDSNSLTGASCEFEGTAECKKTERVCENVPVPYEECTTISVPNPVCEWK